MLLVLILIHIPHILLLLLLLLMSIIIDPWLVTTAAPTIITFDCRSHHLLLLLLLSVLSSSSRVHDLSANIDRIIKSVIVVAVHHHPMLAFLRYISMQAATVTCDWTPSRIFTGQLITLVLLLLMMMFTTVTISIVIIITRGLAGLGETIWSCGVTSMGPRGARVIVNRAAKFWHGFR